MRLCSRHSKDVETTTCRKCRDYRWSCLNICERFRLAQLRPPVKETGKLSRLVALYFPQTGLVAGPGDGHGRHRGGRDIVWPKMAKEKRHIRIWCTWDMCRSECRDMRSSFWVDLDLDQQRNPSLGLVNHFQTLSPMVTPAVQVWSKCVDINITHPWVVPTFLPFDPWPPESPCIHSVV